MPPVPPTPRPLSGPSFFFSSAHCSFVRPSGICDDGGGAGRVSRYRSRDLLWRRPGRLLARHPRRRKRRGGGSVVRRGGRVYVHIPSSWRCSGRPRCEVARPDRRRRPRRPRARERRRGTASFGIRSPWIGRGGRRRLVVCQEVRRGEVRWLEAAGGGATEQRRDAQGRAEVGALSKMARWGGWWPERRRGLDAACPTRNEWMDGQLTGARGSIWCSILIRFRFVRVRAGATVHAPAQAQMKLYVGTLAHKTELR